MSAVRFFYSRRSQERIFVPMYRDFLDEYTPALAEGRTWKARWTRLRFYWNLVSVTGLYSLVRLGRQVWELWRKVA